MIRTAQISKSITAFLLVTAAVFAVITSGGVFAADSKQMTAELFAQKLESFKEEVYANGSTYIDQERVYLGTQCYGFANQIAKYFYGSWPTYNSKGLKVNADWTVDYGSEALQHLHIGDVVRFRSSAGADHSIFITGFDDSKIYFSDANNDHHNTVRHNAEMTWEKIIGKIDKPLEVDESCIGWVAHYKYWDDDPDHAGIGTQLYFNSNGGYIDGERIADRYMVLDTLNMRSGPGLEYERVTKMYDYTYFDVALDAQTTEADGYTWIEVTQGKYSGWAVISEEDWCRYECPVMSSEYYVAKNGGIYKTSDSKALTLTVGDDQQLPDQKKTGLIRKGYDFAGWSDKTDGEPVSMRSLLEKAHGGEMTLYAIWNRNGEETDPETSAVTETETETEELTTAVTTEIEETTEPEMQILKGDINGDGMLDNKDVVTLFNKLSSENTDVDPAIGDINGDGNVDNKDLTYLFRKLSGFTGTVTETSAEPEETDIITETEPEEETAGPEQTEELR